MTIRQLDGLMVGKWQNLGQDYTCHALLRIEPIVRIIDAGPGEAAGATAIGPWLRIDHVAETPFARNAREEIDIVRPLWIRGLEDACVDVADLIAAHQRDGFGPQQPSAVEAALMQ